MCNFTSLRSSGRRKCSDCTQYVIVHVITTEDREIGPPLFVNSTYLPATRHGEGWGGGLMRRTGGQK